MAISSPFAGFFTAILDDIVRGQSSTLGSYAVGRGDSRAQ